MNLNQLGIQRLKIAIQTVENDSRLQVPIKQAFKSLYQTISQHSTSIEIIQTQLTDKISTTQFNYSLTQKLSISEFLQYFQKVQKLMEKVQTHSSDLQRSLFNYIDKNFEENEIQFQQLRKKQIKNMEMEIKQYLQQEVVHKNVRSSKFDDIKQEIEKIKNQISQIKFDAKHVNKILAENDRQKENKSYSSLKQHEANFRYSNEKMCEQIKYIKQFCLQSNKYVKELYENNKHKKKTDNIVTFNEFRNAIQKIENKINLHNTIKSDCSISYIPSASRFMWNFNRHKQIKIYLHSLNSESKTHRQVVKIKKNYINIQVQGIYRITLGVFLSNSGKLYLNLNNKSLSQICFEKDMSSCISKTMILYAFISESSDLELQCDAVGQCRGFFEIEPF